MIKYLLLLITSYIIYLHIFGNNYYLITIFLIKTCPVMCSLMLLSGNLFFLIYLLCHSIYRLVVYNLNKSKIPAKCNIKYIFQMNQNSTKFINYHLLNLPNYNPNQNYIYLYSPHSLYAHGFLHLFGSFNGIIKQPFIGLVHKFFFLTPFLGDLFENCGFMECNYSNIQKMLSLKKTLALIPGGLDEAIITKQNKETIYIKKRKGIFELALKHNTPIIPVMATGESDFYSYPIWSQKLPSKIIRLILYTFSWGKKFMPWMSQKNNIYFMFGEPIFPPKDNSFEINFRDFKNLYTDSLKFIFF